jgi:hypothetical protein
VGPSSLVTVFESIPPYWREGASIDEGHFFHRPENNRAFFAVAEAFLSVHLGGWYQPIDEAEIAASSMVVEAGRHWLPGLRELESPPAKR